MLHFRLLRNVFSNWARTFVAFLVAIVLTPLLFHYLQPSNYAILIFALGVETMLESLDLGLASTLIRYVSDLQARGLYEDLNRLSATSFYFLTAMGILGAAFLAAFSALIASFFRLSSTSGASGSVIIAIISLTLLFHLPGNSMRAVLAGLQDFHLANAVDIASQLFLAAGILSLLHAGYGFAAIASIYPAAALLRLIGMMVMVRQAQNGFSLRPSNITPETLRKVGSFALLTFSQETITRIYEQADNLIAARLLPLPQLAILAVARRFPRALTTISQQAIWVGYPMISSAATVKDHKSVEKFIIVGSRTTLAIVLPLCAGMAVWAGVILRLWVGPGVVSGTPVFRLLAVFAVFASLEEIPLTALYGLGKLRFAVGIAAFLLCGVVAIGAWGSVRYGLVGLVLVFVLLQGVATLLLCRKALSVTQIQMGAWVIKSIVPGVGSMVPTMTWFLLSFRFLPHGLLGLMAGLTGGILIFLVSFGIWVTGIKPLSWSDRARKLLSESD